MAIQNACALVAAISTMNTHRLTLAAILMLGVHVEAAAQTPLPTFDGAQWIWFSRLCPARSIFRAA
jgi:hypothetical protein